ncbi:penicillin-binding protein 2 [Kamptonema cortianum]|nr:penicillin-binding protein 2 [Geitlerinema splendidum]MDK3158817.1 penicillin-binding protein 2 [Kamptonema cortianum]
MSKRRSTERSDRNRLRLVSGLIAVGFVAAGGTQIRTQVVDRHGVIDRALDSGRYQIERRDPPRRGAIFTSDGKVLAESQSAFEFGIFYDRVPKSPAFFAALADATEFSIDELRRPALLGQPSKIWREPVVGVRAERIRQVMSRWRADGISLVRVLERSYPMGELASNVVGAVRNGEPLTGLEKSQNDVLTGKAGKATGFVDRTGVFMPIDTENMIERMNGADLTLTIDSDLQADAARSIREAVEKNRATSGVAVVVEPDTGNILAMASWPTFEPRGKIVDGSDVNYPVMSRYEPGSTFKIMTLGKALDTGAADFGGQMQCSGRLQIASWKTISCDHGAHGLVDWDKAIAESCNVAAATWALNMRREHMIELIEGMGLLQKPGLGLPGEIRGHYDFEDYSKRVQLATNGFGQSLNATPVALANSYAALANGGIRMKPRLIARVGEKPTEIAQAGRVVSKDSADELMRIMVKTIEEEYGTGHSLRISGYRLGGKTGTAQKIAGGRLVGHVSNFVGFVPAEKPRAVVLIMVDEPKAGAIYGGVVAGPVFSELAKSIIRRYNIPPSVGSLPNQPAAGR